MPVEPEGFNAKSLVLGGIVVALIGAAAWALIGSNGNLSFSFDSAKVPSWLDSAVLIAVGVGFYTWRMREIGAYRNRRSVEIPPEADRKQALRSIRATRRASDRSWIATPGQPVSTMPSNSKSQAMMLSFLAIGIGFFTWPIGPVVGLIVLMRQKRSDSALVSVARALLSLMLVGGLAMLGFVLLPHLNP